MPLLESFEFFCAAGSNKKGHTTLGIAPCALLMGNRFKRVHVEVDPPQGFLLAGNALVSFSVDGSFSLRLEIYVKPLAILRFFCRFQALLSICVPPFGVPVLLTTLCFGGRWQVVPILTPTICISMDL